METRARVLGHLKRHGPSTVGEIAGAVGISANAARHHLARLEREGAVAGETERRAGATDRRAPAVGRPAVRYALTLTAEGAFPKRYPELLAALLAQAEHQGVLAGLLDGIVAAWAAPQRAGLAELPPRERLRALLEGMDYGDMLPVWTEDGEGWTLAAHNCLYRDAGFQSAGVCDLLPRVIEAATGLPAERLSCQRDGRPACHFTGFWREAP
jgi:predicted ArsR family transcriptional regulator